MSCPDCFSGHVHDGTPKGQVTTVHGLSTYVAIPENEDEARGIVIIIPDAFGWEFVNNRLLADIYAEKGKYKVYLPDFMKGSAVPVWGLNALRKLLKFSTIYDWISKPYHFACVLFSMVPFMYRNSPAKSWPIVESFFAAVRQNEGARLPIGASGFCWGGKHTITLAHGAEVEGTPLINAGFTGHPSMLSLPGDIEKLKIPVSFALAENDNALPMEQVKQIQNIMEEKEGEVKVYLGASHGFCVRASVHDSVHMERQAAESEDQALDFFNRTFAGVSFE